MSRCLQHSARELVPLAEQEPLTGPMAQPPPRAARWGRIDGNKAGKAYNAQLHLLTHGIAVRGAVVQRDRGPDRHVLGCAWRGTSGRIRLATESYEASDCEGETTQTYSSMPNLPDVVTVVMDPLTSDHLVFEMLRLERPNG